MWATSEQHQEQFKSKKNKLSFSHDLSFFLTTGRPQQLHDGLSEIVINNDEKGAPQDKNVIPEEDFCSFTHSGQMISTACLYVYRPIKLCRWWWEVWHIFFAPTARGKKLFKRSRGRNCATVYHSLFCSWWYNGAEWVNKFWHFYITHFVNRLSRLSRPSRPSRPSRLSRLWNSQMD
jgi:hypothetical protein